jgi:hypothetical protein
LSDDGRCRQEECTVRYCRKVMVRLCNNRWQARGPVVDPLQIKPLEILEAETL